MVRAEDLQPSGCGFESRRILDGKLLQCNLKEKFESIKKVAKWGKLQKKLLKSFVEKYPKGGGAFFTPHPLGICAEINHIAIKKDVMNWNLSNLKRN